MYKIFIFSVVITLLFFVIMPKVEGSIFHSNLHFICHFSMMIMGSLAYRSKQFSCNNRYSDIVFMILSFVAYFLLMKIGKGQNDWRYNIQILALYPLHTFVWYAYKTSSHSFVTTLFKTRICGKILHLIASLTLEIYIVQFMIITDKLNFIFPLNVLLVFIIICIVAYILRVFTRFFLQFLSDKDFSWKEIIQI